MMPAPLRRKTNCLNSLGLGTCSTSGHPDPCHSNVRGEHGPSSPRWHLYQLLVYQDNILSASNTICNSKIFCSYCCTNSGPQVNPWRSVLTLNSPWLPKLQRTILILLCQKMAFINNFTGCICRLSLNVLSLFSFSFSKALKTLAIFYSMRMPQL